MTRRDERGVVAGAEVMALVVLVLVGGMLLSVNAWGVIDTRTALDSAARDYLRAYTTARDPLTAAESGRRAASRVLGSRGLDPARVVVVDPDPRAFGPCAAARVVIGTHVPSVRLPFGADPGFREVRVSHVELIDPHREMAAGDAYDRGLTPCAE